MSDSDEWEDCEETTVLVELQGIIKPDFLKNVEKARVLGIDTDTPYLQLDNNTFKGNYQDCIGTCLLFKDKTDYSADGPEDGKDLQPELEYYGKTCKKLCMHRVFIKGSDSEKTSSQGTSLEEPVNQSTPGTLSNDNMIEDVIQNPASENQGNEELGNNIERITMSPSNESHGSAMNDT